MKFYDREAAIIAGHHKGCEVQYAGLPLENM